MESTDRANADTQDRLTRTTPPMDMAVAERLLLEAKEIMDRFNSIGLPTYVILRPTDPDGVATSATQ